MKKNVIYMVLMLLSFSFSFAQKGRMQFKDGEFFKFRIHYGIINAGYSSVELTKTKKEDKEVYHVVGKGWTASPWRWVYKVEDRYESYFDINTGLPVHYIRDINEGGYKKNIEVFFNHQENTAKFIDHKRSNERDIVIKDEVQDVISTFYYLRSNYDKSIKEGESINMDMLFDGKNFPFQLKFLGKEVIRTGKFGKIPCLKFRPIVQSGRVFKEKESITLWVSDDENLIPLRIKAKIAVGSIKADLIEHRNLIAPLEKLN